MLGEWIPGKIGQKGEMKRMQTFSFFQLFPISYRCFDLIIRWICKMRRCSWNCLVWHPSNLYSNLSICMNAYILYQPTPELDNQLLCFVFQCFLQHSYITKTIEKQSFQNFPSSLPLYVFGRNSISIGFLSLFSIPIHAFLECRPFGRSWRSYLFSLEEWAYRYPSNIETQRVTWT